MTFDQLIALRAITINRPETQTNKLKLTLANSSLLSFFLLKCHVCLSFVIKMRKMTKLRQKIANWLLEVIRVLRYSHSPFLP